MPVKPPLAVPASTTPSSSFLMALLAAVVDNGGYGGSNAGASRVGAATGRWRRQMVRRRRRKGGATLGTPSAASLAIHGGVVSGELAAVGGEMAAVGGEKGGGVSGKNGGGGEIVGAFCEQEPTEAEKIEKTLSTMLPEDRIPTQQYHANNFQKRSLLIHTLTQAERHHELSLKNAQQRPPGSAPLPEVHFNVQNNAENKKGFKGNSSNNPKNLTGKRKRNNNRRKFKG
ncbi:hypothetical protein [Oryza sativa Japonica Group]|uniref:Uncharacterized protein n=1 Tax=Oryza sativa subsp. japonica TaxID=39947 RepID=Q5ZDK9_ORYSJ|nr:hypothetical protein [Oryza sativa Japonica Group]